MRTENNISMKNTRIDIAIVFIVEDNDVLILSCPRAEDDNNKRHP